MVLLGAGGFVFWRTKQGKKVDFESLKKAMQEKGKPRKEPIASRTVEPSIVTSATTVKMKPVESSVVHEEPTFLQPTPEVKPEPKVEPIVAPKPVVEPTKVSLHEDAFNVFDLVSEDATEPMKETVKPAPAPVAKPNVVQTPKFEQSMSDTLEMARSFISINSHNEAIMLLQEVLQSGTSAERQTAQTLLDQIRQQN